ncbi:MAG TPA: peptidoglycan-binding domain-containing protein [Enhygromyxa sp.]|nr:peptidoglycan-binding domain-containing protein [Enhygromyxa sp.]
MTHPLDEATLAAALRYNRSRGYDSATIERIQRVVGAEPIDGLFGPITTRAVFDWQARVGLVQDGKAGPMTLAKINAGVAPSPTIGVWLDDVPNTALRESYFEQLVKLELSSIAVMVQASTANRREAPWRARWTAAQLEQLRELASAHEIAIVLTTWPLPDRDALASFARALPELLDASGAEALEVDTEGNWDASRLAGFASMSDAGQALVETLRALAAPHGARLELTTYPFHVENGAHAQVAPHMDRLFPQAYSVAQRRGGAVDWAGPFGPGRMQDTAVRRSRAIPGVREGRVGLTLGLAGYDQRFADRPARDALSIAFDRATEIGAVELRYWSSRWILGSASRGSPTQAFLASRRELASDEPSARELAPPVGLELAPAGHDHPEGMEEIEARRAHMEMPADIE